jgi:hypothetical protein
MARSVSARQMAAQYGTGIPKVAYDGLIVDAKRDNEIEIV